MAWALPRRIDIFFTCLIIKIHNFQGDQADILAETISLLLQVSNTVRIASPVHTQYPGSLRNRNQRGVGSTTKQARGNDEANRKKSAQSLLVR